jgi:uncharacterized membrane protein
MWGIIFAVVCVFAATMIGFGFLFEKHAPKKRNFILGYRSFRSMSSQEAWDYGNKLSGLLLSRLGIALFVCSVAALIIVHGSSTTTTRTVGIVIVVVHALVVIFSALATELELHKRFDKDGNLR